MSLWIEVSVGVPTGWEELVASVLEALGPSSGAAFGALSLGSAELPPDTELVRVYFALDSEQATRELQERVERCLRALPQRTGARELAVLAPRFRRVPREDFANSWRKVWHPFRVGRWCVVDPTWRGALRPSDRRLVLEPGGAFGTGRHATTRMCLRAIEQHLAPGARVLDCGTGSGILAVASCLAGAASALGFDNDPHALPYAEELARANGVAERCDFRAGGFVDLGPPQPEYDVVLANLYSDVLVAEARRIAAWLAPGGWFVVSGFTRESAGAVSEAFGAAGLLVRSEAARGRWLAWTGGAAVFSGFGAG